MQVKISDKKTVIIKDKEIKDLMKSLDITEEEAVETWLFDHDYTDNEQVEILSKKAKVNKTDKLVITDKTTRKQVERKPKENPTKEMIIDILANALQTSLSLENLQIANKSKLIEFTYLNKQYKLDLIEKRTPKEKN